MVISIFVVTLVALLLALSLFILPTKSVHSEANKKTEFGEGQTTNIFPNTISAPDWSNTGQDLLIKI